MKNKLSCIFNAVIVISLCAVIGYFSYTDLHTTLNNIWEDVLCEDYTNRMNETGVKRIYTYTSSSLPTINITDMQHTKDMHKHKISKAQIKHERSNVANQLYLRDNNPIKITVLDSLFKLRLKENNLDFETAASYYNHNEKITLYSTSDTSFTQTYTKLKKDAISERMIILQSYVKLSMTDYLLHAKIYYLLLITSTISIWLYRRTKYQKSKQLDMPLSNSITICLDCRKHTLTAGDKTILLAPKIFGLFYLLSQSDDYFQPYDTLIEKLWTEKENPDKKHLEQLALRLRKNLADITALRIEAVRGSGYRIKATTGVEVTIEQIEAKGE